MDLGSSSETAADLAVEVLSRRAEVLREMRLSLIEAEQALREAVRYGFRQGLTGHELARASGLPLAEVVLILSGGAIPAARSGPASSGETPPALTLTT